VPAEQAVHVLERAADPERSGVAVELDRPDRAAADLDGERGVDVRNRPPARRNSPPAYQPPLPSGSIAYSPIDAPKTSRRPAMSGKVCCTEPSAAESSAIGPDSGPMRVKSPARYAVVPSTAIEYTPPFTTGKGVGCDDGDAAALPAGSSAASTTSIPRRTNPFIAPCPPRPLFARGRYPGSR
jgi:hypothetical protein